MFLMLSSFYFEFLRIDRPKHPDHGFMRVFTGEKVEVRKRQNY